MWNPRHTFSKVFSFVPFHSNHTGALTCANTCGNPSPVQYVQVWRQELPGNVIAAPALAAGAALSRTGLSYLVILVAGRHVVAVDGSVARCVFCELIYVCTHTHTHTHTPHTHTHTHTHTHRSRYSERWRRDLCDFWPETSCDLHIGAASSPAVSPDGGSAYVCTNKGLCIAVDTANGGKEGRNMKSSYSYVAAPALSPVGHRLYAPSRDTHMLVELSIERSQAPESLNGVKETAMGSKLWSTPLVADNGDVYLCLESGQLVRFNTDGTCVRVCVCIYIYTYVIYMYIYIYICNIYIYI